MWLESTPYEHSWADIQDFSDGDKAIEIDWLDYYFQVSRRGGTRDG